jgi:hypothetical protein
MREEIKLLILEWVIVGIWGSLCYFISLYEK